MTEREMKKVIEAYETRGIVTRNECRSIDSRALSKEILKEMHNRGYSEAKKEEANLEGYVDYSNIIYNSDVIEFQEAKDYLIKHVLSK